MYSQAAPFRVTDDQRPLEFRLLLMNESPTTVSGSQVGPGCWSRRGARLIEYWQWNTQLRLTAPPPKTYWGWGSRTAVSGPPPTREGSRGTDQELREAGRRLRRSRTRLRHRGALYDSGQQVRAVDAGTLAG